MYRQKKGPSGAVVAIVREADGHELPIVGDESDEYRAFAAWLAAGHSPTPDETRETVIARQWERIKAERDRRAHASGYPVTIDGAVRWFHSDAPSRVQHLGLKDKARDLLAAGGTMADPIRVLGQPVAWKTMSGEFVALTAQVAFDLIDAAGVLDAQLFVAAETHRARMAASADPGAYDFAGGWAPAFTPAAAP